MWKRKRYGFISNWSDQLIHANTYTYETMGIFGRMTRVARVSLTDNSASQSEHLELTSKNSNMDYRGEMPWFMKQQMSVVWNIWRFQMRKNHQNGHRGLHRTNICTPSKLESTRVAELGHHFQWLSVLGATFALSEYYDKTAEYTS